MRNEGCDISICPPFNYEMLSCATFSLSNYGIATFLLSAVVTLCSLRSGILLLFSGDAVLCSLIEARFMSGRYHMLYILTI